MPELAINKICPFFFTATLVEPKIHYQGTVYKGLCLGSQCGFFRGNEKDESGICSIKDTAGYLNIFNQKLDSESTKGPEKQEPNQIEFLQAQLSEMRGQIQSLVEALGKKEE